MQENVPVFVTPPPPVNTYTSRPVSIEAVQWDGTAEAASQIINWALETGGSISYWCASGSECREATSSHKLRISTLEGDMDAEAGAWVIKGTEGEFYPCKDSVFQRKYRAGDGDTSNLIIPPDLRQQLETNLDGPITVRPLSLHMTMVEASPLTLTGASEPGIEIRHTVLVTKAEG
jgi:hypothetical protein